MLNTHPLCRLFSGEPIGVIFGVILVNIVAWGEDKEVIHEESTSSKMVALELFGSYGWKYN
jgi:hypothetical protein